MKNSLLYVPKTRICRLFVLIFFALLFIQMNVFSQGVGIGTSSFTPTGSSILELQGSAKGFLVPRMNWASRPTSGPVEGLLFYCDNATGAPSTGVGFYFYRSGAWSFVGSGNVSTVTASSPLASTGGANPDISLTGTIPIANG